MQNMKAEIEMDKINKTRHKLSVPKAKSIDEKVENNMIFSPENREKPVRLAKKVIDEHENEEPNYSSIDSENSLSDFKQPDKQDDDIEIQIKAKTEKNHQNFDESGLNELSFKSKEGSISEEKVYENIANRSKDSGVSLKSNKLDIAIWEYLCSFICKPKCLDKKIKAINEGIKDIDMRLDVRFIITKIRELEKLKALLLDNNQLLLFNDLPKTQIKAYDENEEKKTLTEATFRHMILSKFCTKAPKLSQQEIFQAYSQIKRKKNKTDVDKKLIQIYNECFE